MHCIVDQYLSYLRNSFLCLESVLVFFGLFCTCLLWSLYTMDYIQTVASPVSDLADVSAFQSHCYLQVVLIPVILGIGIKRAFPKAVDRVTPYSPMLAVLMVALICATVMARSAEAARQASPMLFLAVFGLHAGGFALGYLASRVFGLPEATSRTNSIEVGMQNSTLGASLALLHFADPLTAVPCAISACMHSILGSCLAGVWRNMPPNNPEVNTKAQPELAP